MEKNQKNGYDNNVLGTDVKLIETSLGSDLSLTESGDITFVNEEINLAQAILHRLRTIKGELYDIGHSNYGSRLYDFIGEPNDETTRERIKITIRDTLIEEERVKQILNISVKSRSLSPYEKQGYQNQSHKHGLSDLGGITETGIIESEIIDVDPRASLSTVDILISVIPIGSEESLNITFPLKLEVT